MIRQRTPLTPLTPHTTDRQTDKQQTQSALGSARLDSARLGSARLAKRAPLDLPTPHVTIQQYGGHGADCRTANVDALLMHSMFVYPAIPAAPPSFSFEPNVL
ncbi:hypothetical protein ALC56_06189 [Trachymyrmex septentrionalis]|uniref:Uncharacterized protein n=1 Tax=Trachymyrmex septentrionalis TaxID=34720 RepID=A0A195FI95_9HYME|nr:hypothetical protein ALC56_06189 [Trachymyrmex septentrionalis]